MTEATPIEFDARAARRQFPSLRQYAPHIGVSAVAATVALGAVMRSGDELLGAPLAPFFASWDPRFTLAVLVPIAAFALVLAAVPRLFELSPSAFGASSFAAVLVLTLALALARGGGTHAWSAVFGTGPEAANEYLPALPALAHGASGFLDRFAEVATTLPVHPSAHPPGLLLTLHGLGIDTPAAMAVLVIGVGALTAPLTYLLARQLTSDIVARAATLCFCFSPAALLYLATSADALYAALGTAAAAALVTRRRALVVGGSILLSVASFFSYALLAVGAWAGIVLLRRDGMRRAASICALCAAALLTFYLSLYFATGFDPVGGVRAAHDVYSLGIARVRPYAYWLFGSPAAFLVATGLPVMWFALRALGRGEAAAIALAGIVLTAAVVGLTKGEVERIWLFMVPLACVAAATQMPRRWLRPALAIMAAQALAVQVLTVTVW